MPGAPRHPQAQQAMEPHTLRYTGPDAASRKYDLIAALGCHGLITPGRERLALRLITLLTARYNWRRGELAVGQREIARLWGVTERTAKRDMAKLRGLGWLTVRRPAARGRVACYALNSTAILAATAEAWPAMGPDFEARLAAHVTPDPGARVVHVNFQAMEGNPPADAQIGDGPPGEAELATGWDGARAQLRQEDPAVFENWYRHLSYAGHDADTLRLRAPNAYIAQYVETHLAGRILRAATLALGPVTKMVIDCV